MARGGSGKPDGASPFRSAAGVELKRLKSSRSKTGYLCIVEPREGQFWIKLKLDGVKGNKKQKLFGTRDGHHFASAEDAATALAEYPHYI